jgi:superfamily I DNA and/or RNA helicase
MQVEMCTSIVRYMLQQGYGPDQITVLTPYLGQLLELQKALSAEFQVCQTFLIMHAAGKNSCRL